MSKASQNIELSLIPVVREEETRLLAMLEETRAQAGQLVDAARKSAEERIEAARAQLPDLIRQTRERGLEDRLVGVRSIRDSSQQEVAALEQTAHENLPAAVRRIIAIVLPGADV